MEVDQNNEDEQSTQHGQEIRSLQKHHHRLRRHPQHDPKSANLHDHPALPLPPNCMPAHDIRQNRPQGRLRDLVDGLLQQAKPRPTAGLVPHLHLVVVGGANRDNRRLG